MSGSHGNILAVVPRPAQHFYTGLDTGRGPHSFIGRMKRSLGFSSQTVLEEQSSHSNLLLQQFKAFLESFEV